MIILISSIMIRTLIVICCLTLAVIAQEEDDHAMPSWGKVTLQTSHFELRVPNPKPLPGPEVQIPFFLLAYVLFPLGLGLDKSDTVFVYCIQALVMTIAPNGLTQLVVLFFELVFLFFYKRKQ